MWLFSIAEELREPSGLHGLSSGIEDLLGDNKGAADE
jgi:hypothetical protein